MSKGFPERSSTTKHLFGTFGSHRITATTSPRALTSTFPLSSALSRACTPQASALNSAVQRARAMFSNILGDHAGACWLTTLEFRVLIIECEILAQTNALIQARELRSSRGRGRLRAPRALSDLGLQRGNSLLVRLVIHDDVDRQERFTPAEAFCAVCPYL